MNFNNQGSNKVQAARLYNSCLDQLLEKTSEIVKLKFSNELLASEPPNCNPKLFSECQCTSPAKYSPEGFGNCHYKDSKAGQRAAWLWCYVEPKFGDPRNVCPDAIASVSSPGWYWSRMACLAD